jgi:hypothetical protein
VAWAGRVTVRRLRDDVEQALALLETDPEGFRRGGGRPPEVCGDREIGAAHRGTKEHVSTADEGCSVRFIGSADVVQLFRVLLSSSRAGGPAE